MQTTVHNSDIAQRGLVAGDFIPGQTPVKLVFSSVTFNSMKDFLDFLQPLLCSVLAQQSMGRLATR